MKLTRSTQELLTAAAGIFFVLFAISLFIAQDSCAQWWNQDGKDRWGELNGRVNARTAWIAPSNRDGDKISLAIMPCKDENGEKITMRTYIWTQEDRWYLEYGEYLGEGASVYDIYVLIDGREETWLAWNTRGKDFLVFFDENEDIVDKLSQASTFRMLIPESSGRLDYTIDMTDAKEKISKTCGQ